MTRKTTFFDGWCWFKFNNLGLALCTNLKFYTRVEKGLKLKVRKFWGLIPTFVEVTGEKLVGGWGLFGPSWIGLKFYIVSFYFMPNWGLPEYTETKLETTNKKRSGNHKQKEVWNRFSCQIFCIISEEQHFSCYILLTDQISLSDYLYFARYWAVCVLWLFYNQVLTS